MNPNESNVHIEEDPFANVFERYEKLELQELFLYQLTNWNTLLSQECKFTTDPLYGLVESKTDCFSGSDLLLLVPVEESFSEPYDMRDFHTILKDITLGMYAFNQPPNITLEPNHDLTSNCSCPPAYLDTFTGKLLIEFDCWIKALWHGVSMDRDTRMRVLDKWRELETEVKPENIEILADCAGTGLHDLSKDPLYAEHYTKLPIEHPLDEVMTQDRQLFEKWLDMISMRLVLMTGSFNHNKNLLICNYLDHFVDVNIRAMDDEISPQEYQKLFVRTSYHRDIIAQCLAKKKNRMKMLSLLKLVSLITVVVQSCKNQKARIPVMSNLFCHLQGESTKTERQLPPIVIPKTCASRTFMHSKTAAYGGICSHVHGGIGFQIDSDHVTFNEEIDDNFIQDVLTEAQQTTELFTSEIKRPTQQRYPVPVVNFKGKRYNVLHIRLEEYFPPPNTKPLWLAHLHDEFNKRTKDKDNQKKLLVPETIIHDTFKRVFGYAHAIKCKNYDIGFSSSLQRDLLAIFWTLLRRVQSARLSSQNERGYALLHLAAIYNRVNMAAALISLGMDFNAKRGGYLPTNGPTALHLASRAGSLEVVSCLSSLGGSEYSNCITFNDNYGWTAVHHAAYFDHVPILLMILRRLEAADKQGIEIDSTDSLRHTPLMLTATSGALDSMKTLIKYGARIDLYDKKGNGIVELAVIHFHTKILEWLISQNFESLPVFDKISKMLRVSNENSKDPEIINRAAAAARCIDILTSKNTNYWPQLLESGAVAGLVSWLRLPPDVEENQMSPKQRKKSALKSASSVRVSTVPSAAPSGTSYRESLSRQTSVSVINPPVYIDPSQPLKVRRALARKAKLNEAMMCLLSASVSALCNIGAEPRIRTELANLGAGQMLSKLLIVPDPNIQARAATVLGDVCADPEQQDDEKDENSLQSVLADLAFRNLVPLLNESSEDVLVAAVNALRFLVTGNPINQTRIASYCFEAVQAIVDFLSVSESNSLRGAAAACIAALAAGHADNQTILLELDAAPALVTLLKARNVSVAVRAAAAVAAMAAENPRCQQRLFELDAAKPLVRVLKMVFVPMGTTSDDETDEKETENRTHEISAWSLEVKEQTMTALWALAGHTVAQRRRVAELISLQTLVELLITDSDPLRRHSAFAVAAFCREDRSKQNEVFRGNAVEPILRLIRAFNKVSEETLVLLIKALGALCYLPAYTANEVSQMKLYQQGALKDLLKLLIANIPPANTQLVRVTILEALSLLTLSNTELRGALFNALGFKLEPLLSLVSNLSEDSTIRLAACQALATFSLHNNPLQLRISELGGLRYDVFAPFLNSAGWRERCLAAFQIVLLSRIVSDADQVALTAAGVLVLVQALEIEGDYTLLTVTCNLIATLCHGRSGVSDAFVSAGVLSPLIYHLMNEISAMSNANKPLTLNFQVNAALTDALGKEDAKASTQISSRLIEEVQLSASIALCFVSKNRTARRLMLSECRKSPCIYKRLSVLVENAGFKFDEEFEAEYAAIAAHNSQIKISPSRADSRLSQSQGYTSYRNTSPSNRPKTAASSKQSPPISVRDSQIKRKTSVKIVAQT